MHNRLIILYNTGHMCERSADQGYVEGVSHALSLPPDIINAAWGIQVESRERHQMGSLAPGMEPTLCTPMIIWDKKTNVKGRPPKQEVVVYEIPTIIGWESCGKPECCYMGREGPRERKSFEDSMKGAKREMPRKAIG